MSTGTGIPIAVSRVQTSIPVGPGLNGDLAVPPGAVGVTLFAHGSGSSRFSPRNRHVANALNSRGIATLLFDLLTPREEPERGNVFDVDLLGGRLEEVTHWLREHPLAQGLEPSYFGASTGAAAALTAASRLGPVIRSVVSRGGRPDLAHERLSEVVSPTLLIVGALDEAVLGLNREVYRQLVCERQLAIVDRAGHLFEEPGALERVAALTGDWLTRHFATPSRGAADLGEVEVEVEPDDMA